MKEMSQTSGRHLQKHPWHLMFQTLAPTVQTFLVDNAKGGKRVRRTCCGIAELNG